MSKAESETARPVRWQFSLRTMILFVTISAIVLAVARFNVSAGFVFAVGFAVGVGGVAATPPRGAANVFSFLFRLITSVLCVWIASWVVVFVWDGYPRLPMFEEERQVLFLVGVAGGVLGSGLKTLRQVFSRGPYHSE